MFQSAKIASYSSRKENIVKYIQCFEAKTREKPNHQ
jgi:hypothetical protein